MNYSERSVPLSTSDISRIRSENRIGTAATIAILPILLAAAAFFFYLGSDFLPFRIFAPIFAIMAIGIVATNLYRQRMDRTKSTKTIITAEIEDKNESHTTSSSSNGSNSHYYYFILNGKEFPVDSVHYSQFHIHDKIVIEKLPYTGKILSISLLESSTGIDSEQLLQRNIDGSRVHDARSYTDSEFSETSYPLDTDEEQYLQRSKSRRIFRMFRYVPIPLYIYLIMRIMVMEGSLWQEIRNAQFTLTQFIVFLPILIQVLRIPKKIKPYTLDVNSGMKTIRRTVITDKRHGINNRTNFWCITICCKEYDVPELFYSAIDIGEEIQFHYAENTEVIFSIRSTKNSSVFTQFY